MPAASVGLRVRTGSAVVVLLTGTRRAPSIVLRHEIDLADPWIAESRHPYHEELGEGGAAAVAARERGCEAARRSSERAIRTLIEDARSHGFELGAAAVVVASLADPARILGAHARAHAEEGRLYREAVATALDGHGLRPAILLEKALSAKAGGKLGGPDRLHAILKSFSRVVGTPWRAPEKQAALAAWLVLPGVA